MTECDQLPRQYIDTESVRHPSIRIDFALVPLEVFVHGPALETTRRRVTIIAWAGQKLLEAFFFVYSVRFFRHMLAHHLVKAGEKTWIGRNHLILQGVFWVASVLEGSARLEVFEASLQLGL